MKKTLVFSVIFVLILALLCGCEDTGTPGDTKTTEPPVTTEPTVVLVPSVAVEKVALPLGEEIVVSYEDAAEGNFVGIKSADALLARADAVGAGTVRFPTEGMTPGSYEIVLGSGDETLAQCAITLVDPAEADYGAKAAVLHAEKTDGVSKSSVTVTPAYGKKLTYTLYWSQGGARLAGYAPLATVTSSGTEPFDVALNDTLFMPDDADGVEISVLEGVSTPLYIAADDTLKVPASKLLYSFSVLSDLHLSVMQPVYNSHLQMALADLHEIAPELSAIVTTGDITDDGKRKGYELAQKYIKEEATDKGWDVSFYFAIGNHDLDYASTYEKQLSLFLEQTGMPGLYYTFAIGGTKCIVLGSDENKKGGVMHEDQFAFLEAELRDAGTEQPVFLFVHEPLIDTVAGALSYIDPGVQHWFGFTEMSARLRDLLRQYPNAILFTGHTHWTFESYQPVLYGYGTDASFVGCPSVGYLWNDDNLEEPGSEGLIVEVYEDYILLKGREFTERKWCAAAQLLFPLS